MRHGFIPGKLLRRDARPQTIVVGSLSRTLDVPGWYPDDDSDSVHSGLDLKTLNEAYKELREQYAAHVKSVRKGSLAAVSARSKNMRAAAHRRATRQSV